MKFLAPTLLSLVILTAPAFAEESEEVTLAREVLRILQPTSIAENREYCGYIGYVKGRLTVSSPQRGTATRCAPLIPPGMKLTASYHTHSAFDPDTWSEIPSQLDVDGDREFGIDGYVSTPAGRFWYIDTEAMTITQLCGVGCLPSDPSVDLKVDGKIRWSYTYEQLIEKLEE